MEGVGAGAWTSSAPSSGCLRTGAHGTEAIECLAGFRHVSVWRNRHQAVVADAPDARRASSNLPPHAAISYGCSGR